MQLIDKLIEDYCVSKSNIPSSDCEVIESYTRSHVHGSNMLIGKMEASFLGFLLRTINAKRVLELGTYTGYSALTMAENIADDGEIITVDINPDTVSLAKDFWAKSHHGKKIRSLIGSALEVIPTLDGEFDLVFIDADKRHYLDYLKMALTRLSSNGIVVIDNVLWSGRVVYDSETSGSQLHDRNTEFIKAVNDYVASDKTLYGTLLPIRDGMFLIRKIS